jgi:hypothetical protein
VLREQKRAAAVVTVDLDHAIGIEAVVTPDC